MVINLKSYVLSKSFKKLLPFGEFHCVYVI